MCRKWLKKKEERENYVVKEGRKDKERGYRTDNVRRGNLEDDSKETNKDIA